MYQIVVIGLGLVLLFGAGYYIKRTDNNGVIQQSLSNKVETIATDTDSSIETDSIEKNEEIPVIGTTTSIDNQ